MRLFIPLTRSEFDALRQIALTERRSPQDQAAAMLAPMLVDGSSSCAASPPSCPDPFMLPATDLPCTKPTEARNER